MNTQDNKTNVLTMHDKETITLHFAGRLYERYNISSNPYKLQNRFQCLVSSGKATKIRTYEDKAKGLYVCMFQGKKILFVYNNQIRMAKTVL